MLSSPIHLLPLPIDSSDDIRQCSGYSPSLSSSLGDLRHTWCFSSHMYVQDNIFQSGLLFSSLGSDCLWSSLFISNYWQVEGQLGEINVIESRLQLHVKTSLSSVWASSATWGWLEFLSLAGTAMGASCDWITAFDTSREKTWSEELWTLLHPVTSDEKKNSGNLKCCWKSRMHTVKMRACSGRHDPAPEWEREQLMWDTGESSSIPWSSMICYGTLLVTGKEQFMGESSMSPAALGGLLCCAQREELLFARGTSAWQAPGPGSQQNWQSADNIFFFVMKYILFLVGFWVLCKGQNGCGGTKQQPYRGGL